MRFNDTHFCSKGGNGFGDWIGVKYSSSKKNVCIFSLNVDVQRYDLKSATCECYKGDNSS